MKADFAGLGLTALLVLGRIALLCKPGLNFGVDFRGGIQWRRPRLRPRTCRTCRFAVPMAIGSAIAAASSVFIAALILLFLGDWQGRRPAAP